MDMLDDNIESMREHGIGLGLSDREIDECIYKSLQPERSNPCQSKDKDIKGKKYDAKCTKPENARQRKRISAACLCGVLCSVTKLICVGLGLLLGCYLLTAFHEPSGVWVSKTTHAYSYQIQRLVRWMSLPIWKFKDLSNYHGSNCLLPNPWFLQTADIDCEICHDVENIPEINQSSPEEFHNRFIKGNTPCIVLGEMDGVLSFQDLKDAYVKNKHKLQKKDLILGSSLSGITSLDKLMNRYDEQKLKVNPHTHIEWYALKIGAAQLLREVFKRPKFVPKTSEVAVEKVMYIDSPKAKPYSLQELPAGSNVWYVQGSGQRHLVLVPIGGCGLHCKSHQIVMSPGQIFYYPAGAWRIDSVPVLGPNATQDISISFLGSFH